MCKQEQGDDGASSKKKSKKAEKKEKEREKARSFLVQFLSVGCRDREDHLKIDLDQRSRSA